MFHCIYIHTCSTNAVYTDIFMHVAVCPLIRSYTSLSAGVSCGGLLSPQCDGCVVTSSLPATHQFFTV